MTAWTLGLIALAAGSLAEFAWGINTTGAIVIALMVWFVLLIFTALIKQVNRS